MLPADHVQVRMVGSEAVPHWLGEEDHAWLSALIDDFARLAGRPYREVRAFLREPPRVPSPAGKRRMAIWMIHNLCRRERPPLNASTLRETVALEAQRARDAGRFDRVQVLAAAARGVGLTAAAADEHLFADFPGERRLGLPDPLPDHCRLAARTNLALAQGLLRLASEITVELYGGARAVVRQVRLRRLLCTVRRAGPEQVRLEISGAYSLFRHTTLYGRALASILPLLGWCQRFELAARCVLRGRAVTLRLRSGDPIAAGPQPRVYDSRLEERFAREFARCNLDWDLDREPEPVEAGEVLVFPDFAIVHRRDRSRRFLLEIVGFWTPDYLRAKLEHLRAMPRTPLVLCIDRALNCSAGDLPAQARLVWFHRRIDPRAVLEVIQSPAAETAAHAARIGPVDLFLDWAGRRPAGHAVHRRIAALKPGDPVRLQQQGMWVAIAAAEGPIAMLSRAGAARWAPRLECIVAARLVEKLKRRAAQSPPQWRHRLRCEHWEVPVVEVTLPEPAD